LPYRASIVLLTVAGAAIVLTLLNSFTDLLDLATSAAFVIAPIIAGLNHLVVTRCKMPDSARPNLVMKTLNISAIVIMAGLGVSYFMI